MMPRIKSLAPTPMPSLPSTRISNVCGRSSHRHCVASTCSTSLVPIPNASAPNAPCVAVWLSPQTIVIPGCVSPSSGPMTCTIPCSRDPISNSLQAELRAVAPQRFDLQLRIGVGDRLAAIGRRHVVILRGVGAMRRANLAPRMPQALERLRRRDLVHQVQVDVEQGRLMLLFADDVLFPDFLEQGFCGHCVLNSRRVGGVTILLRNSRFIKPPPPAAHSCRANNVRFDPTA